MACSIAVTALNGGGINEPVIRSGVTGARMIKRAITRRVYIPARYINCFGERLIPQCDQQAYTRAMAEGSCVGV